MDKKFGTISLDNDFVEEHQDKFLHMVDSFRADGINVVLDEEYDDFTEYVLVLQDIPKQ